VRNLSFALTTEQVRARTKTVTRRRGTWWARVLKPGDLLCAVEKSQGIRKGELVRLGTIRVRNVRVEPLNAIEGDFGSLRVLEVTREGFPQLTSREFVAMFCRHMGGSHDQLVTRIEFEYVDPTEARP